MTKSNSKAAKESWASHRERKHKRTGSMLLRRKRRAWKRKEKGRAWPFGLGELRSGSSTAWAHLAGHGSNRVGQTRSAVSISLPSGYRHAYFIGNCLSKPAEDPAAARKFLREIERWPSQTSSDCSPRSSERQRLEPKTEGHTSGNASTTSLQRNFRKTPRPRAFLRKFGRRKQNDLRGVSACRDLPFAANELMMYPSQEVRGHPVHSPAKSSHH